MKCISTLSDEEVKLFSSHVQDQLNGGTTLCEAIGQAFKELEHRDARFTYASIDRDYMDEMGYDVSAISDEAMDDLTWALTERVINKFYGLHDIIQDLADELELPKLADEVLE